MLLIFIFYIFNFKLFQRAEENRESQNPYRPLFQPAHEKKKSKSMRKKDAEKNSQIIDPSREPSKSFVYFLKLNLFIIF